MSDEEKIGTPFFSASGVDGQHIDLNNNSNQTASFNQKNCIIPGTLFGATPYDVSFQGGFGGRPGTHTVKYVNPDGKYDIDINNIDVNNPIQVGIDSLKRSQVLTDFEIDRSVGGKILTARFQDKAIVDLQRHLIVCRQIVKFGSFASRLIGDGLSRSCVSVYGRMFHLKPGAPSRLDLDTLDPGPSPVIYIGGDASGNTGGRNSSGPAYKKISQEYVFWNSTWIANDAKIGKYIGPGLRNLLVNDNNKNLRFLQHSGNALDIIVSLAGACGWFLYANEEGKLDALSSLPRISRVNASNLGAQCSVTSIKEKVSITNTFDKGGWATWKHDDNYEAEFKANFLAIDLLGIPIPVCDPADPLAEKDDAQARPQNAGNGDGAGEEVSIISNSSFVSMYEKNMSKSYIAQLKRFLKMSVLDHLWENWEGMTSYIHLKRLRETSVNGTIKVFTTQGKKHHDGKNIITDCQQKGILPVKGGDKGKIGENAAVNKLFPCLSPAVLNFPVQRDEDQWNKAMLNDNANKNQEIKVPRGGGRQILVLDAGQNLACANLKNGKRQPMPNGDHELKGKVQGGKWAGGAAADRAELLKTLALSIGRWWILADGRGNGGGGGSLMTQRQHGYRNYHPSHGTISWYDKRMSVRDTPFAGIYERVYGDRLSEWESVGGIRRVGTIKEEEERELALEEGREVKDTYDEVKDLSISEFLQLAYRLKYRSITGDRGGSTDEEIEEEAFKGGGGMDSGEIESANETARELCARGEPLGLVIWDSNIKEPELPLQNEWMASIGAGVESKTDKMGSDIVRWSMQQATLGVIMNPMKKLKNVVKKKNGESVVDVNSPDSLEASLDNIILNRDFEAIGQNRVKKILFESKRARRFFHQHAELPNCDNQVFKSQFAHKKMDGQILWRSLDCYGNIEPWRSYKEGYSSGHVLSVLESEVSTMIESELDPESSYTVTTCGQSAPNLPSVGQGLQSYTVSIAKDGSVMTTFQLSREAMRSGSSFSTAYYENNNYNINAQKDPTVHTSSAQSSSADIISFDMNQQNLQAPVKLHNGQFLL